MNNMGVAFELLGVGMVTVFLILSIVVILGNLIIKFVNRYIPEIKKVSDQMGDTVQTEIHPRKVAAIVSAVNIVTNNTGRVIKVEKL